MLNRRLVLNRTLGTLERPSGAMGNRHIIAQEGGPGIFLGISSSTWRFLDVSINDFSILRSLEEKAFSVSFVWH
jgi:hypothetical protein